MKKIILPFVIVLISIYSYGQKISGGIFVSPELSWMQPDVAKNISNEGIKLGYGIGLIGDYNFSDNFAFSTGFVLNTFGGELQYADSIPEFTVSEGTADSIYSFSKGAIIEYNLKYIEIPITLKGKVNFIALLNPYDQGKAQAYRRIFIERIEYDGNFEDFINSFINEGGIRAL